MINFVAFDLGILNYRKALVESVIGNLRGGGNVVALPRLTSSVLVFAKLSQNVKRNKPHVSMMWFMDGIY